MEPSMNPLSGMEPSVILMGRGLQSAGMVPLKIDTTERHPGDGMEAHLSNPDLNISLSPASYKKSLAMQKNLKSTKSPKSPKSPRIGKKNNIKNIMSNQQEKKKKRKGKSDVLPSYSMDDLSVLVRRDERYSSSSLDSSIVVDSLKTKLAMFEEHNNQLIEEKIKLSHQLGVQTQVNNELKNLLVASIGDDLQQKYERMIQDKYLADLELRHLHNVLEEDREEVEHAHIQADVWRSKFLASRVMTDELSRWKSALYYKYRESHTALQTLLEEHSKMRALNNATKKGLIQVVELLKCKDPSLDVEKPLTTIDVAYMNTDLVESICEILSEPKSNEEPANESDLIKGKEDKPSETVIINEDRLTHAECLAQMAVLNPEVQTEELTRMRRDYLAHNRISHFLSTNYQVTFNCCENCTGTLEII